MKYQCLRRTLVANKHFNLKHLNNLLKMDKRLLNKSNNLKLVAMRLDYLTILDFMDLNLEKINVEDVLNELRRQCAELFQKVQKFEKPRGELSLQSPWATRPSM